jgi:hypothetical protein
MLQGLRQWKLSRRIKRVINHATKIMYSENAEFPELVAELVFHHSDAAPAEIYLSIDAVVKYEEELEALVHSKYDIPDKDVFKRIVGEVISELDEIATAESNEIAGLLNERCEVKAQRAYHLMRMAFTLERLESEESFAGAVYKAKKIKNGPITIKQRRTFKRLTEQLQTATDKIKILDEEIAEMSEDDHASET